MNADFDLEQQRRLLVSLGFGFVEAPLELPESESAPPPPPPPRVSSRPTRPEPAAERPAAPRRSTPPTIGALNQLVSGCDACTLHLVRRQALPGGGGATPRLLAVVDPPTGADDTAGALMAGPVGDMATKLFAAMKLSADQVFVTGAVKCAPKATGEATNIQLKACQPHLHDQIRLLKPQVIVCFGDAALRAVYTLAVPNAQPTHPGHWIEGKRIPIMPTLSLRECVRDSGRKRALWAHMQLVMARLGIG